MTLTIWRECSIQPINQTRERRIYAATHTNSSNKTSNSEHTLDTWSEAHLTRFLLVNSILLLKTFVQIRTLKIESRINKLNPAGKLPRNEK